MKERAEVCSLDNYLVLPDNTMDARIAAARQELGDKVIVLGHLYQRDEVIRWDGVPNEIEEWNRDHTLRSAMQYSVVPVFQQIANRIGSERMKQFVDSFDYGNRDIGGAPLDKFWLEGGELTCEVARKPFGRLAIANADAGAYAYTDCAIDQAYRAVLEIIKSSYDVENNIVE